MFNIKVVPYDEVLRPEIIKFSSLIHPHINDHQHRLEWLAFGNPFLKEKNRIPGLFALNERNELIGRFLLNEQDWHFNGTCRSGYWGYDFFVREDYRRMGVGALLLTQLVRTYRPFFAMGLTDIAKKIYAALGIREIGYIRKFLWLNKPVSAAFHFTRRFFGQPSEKADVASVFPEFLKSRGINFCLLSDSVPESYRSNYDPHVLEFSRSKEFLQWRFFRSKEKYYFYYTKDISGGAYFVLRDLVYKGIRFLFIVDYKIPSPEPKLFQQAIGLVKKLAHQNKVDGIITTSSNLSCDNALQKEFFLPVGNPTPVYSTIGDEAEFSSLGNRNPLFMTMGNADLDLNFGDHL